MTFLQEAPRPSNRLRTDPAFAAALRRALPPEVLEDATPELQEMGERAVSELPSLQERAESNPPRLVRYDGWGRRIDRIEVDPAWEQLVRIGQEAGFAALPYEQRYGEHARTVQFALLTLFNPYSATADCPLSMTDAAARVLLNEDPAIAEQIVPKLTARRDGWTSGQWMTETTGGSDVGRTETVARRAPDGTWTLHGVKWFTSATTADVALALARPEGAEAGSRGLSLFLLELRRADGAWNGIRVRRLKDKLGTKALPTAELELDGTVARMVGSEGRGVAKIAAMLNITRVHAAFGGIGATSGALSLARGYARRREAFGRPLAELPAHRGWIARVAATYEAMLALGFHAAALLGAAERGRGDPLLTRLTMPLAKMAVARQGVWTCSELIESFGGAGYVEDTGIPRFLRDAHVQCIWEGTTTVLALDVLRALRPPEAMGSFLDDLEGRARRSEHPKLDEPVRAVRAALDELKLIEPAEGSARRLAWGMARTAQAALLCEAAAWELRANGGSRAATAAALFCGEELVPPDAPATDDELAALAFGDDA